MDVGKVIKQLRADAGLSQAKLAERLKISRANLASYETNRNKVPFELLIDFSKFFGVSTDYLLGLED